MRLRHNSIWKIAALVLLCAALCGFATGAFAVEFTDGLGRTVQVADAPERIVVLPVWAEEMLLDMVGPKRIAGVSVWGDQEALSPTAALAKEVKARVSSDDAEGILALKPDLVVLDTFSAGFDGALVGTLQDAGLTVVCLASPTDFGMVMDTLTQLGEITGEQAKAAEMVGGVRKTLMDIAVKVAQIPDEGRIKVMFYEDYYDQSGSAGMLCAYGPGSAFDAIVAAAGAINVCDAPNYSPVSKEMVVAQWKPEILIVPSAVFDAKGKAKEDGGAAIIEGIKADATLASVPAVQSGNIFAIADQYRGSTSHYMAEAAMALAKLAYPMQFE